MNTIKIYDIISPADLVASDVFSSMLVPARI